MSRRLLAAVLAVALLVGAAVYSRRAQPPASPSGELPASPQDCLSRMVEAAQRGDVAAYLACFSGALHEELANQARSPRFGEHLSASVAELKGIATHPSNTPTPDAVELVVERLFVRHNEVQRVMLRRADGRWRIERMTSLGTAVPPVEYGTPVFQPSAPPAVNPSQHMR